MDMITPKISVLMASYRHRLWLPEAIESILKQTYTNFELIIVDDASNDGSADIIKLFQKKDTRIKYEIFEQNKGAVRAFKRCYDLSSGEYIAIMNSDDVWELDKLEKQMAIFNNDKNVDIVFGMPSFIDAKGQNLSLDTHVFMASLRLKTRAEFMNHFFFYGNCLCHPTILIKKECYQKHGFYKKTLRSLPDFEMWVRLFWHYNVIVLPDILIKFRNHSFNESSNSLQNAIRGSYEYKITFHSFLAQIKTIKDIEEVFPQHKHFFIVQENILVPFYIAMLALTRKEPFARDFALTLLYEELEKPEVLDLIENNNLYSLVQLSKDVAGCNIYRYA